MGAEESKVEAVFYAALERDSAAERAAYLKEVCAGDSELRGRVELLVGAQPNLGRFLENDAAAVAVTIDQPVTEKPGATIGRYKLLEEIGEGGMGVVYMAEQREPVRRKVALKIIKPGMDTREVVARFEAERQALAMMDHPNVAHVLDGGATESGRPYFVMDLVQGIPITEYCDQASLTTRERLALFVLVCQAVQHAHQKGIIHRDLKPSNVLVTLHDGVPVPKIIDFGIAKATHGQLTEKTLFTGFGRMMGTPVYMSPEQAEMSGLDVDTRSDVYSLGVLLYEMLTGSTPFDPGRLHDAGFDEVRRVVREEEPPRPSHRLSTLDAEAVSTITAHRGVDARRLGRLLRGDLDWIVMKALEKDRNRRYESASALAADIERHLANEPIEARPPTLADRAAKWARRHRPLVGAAAVSLGIILAILASSTFLVLAAYQGEKEQRGAAEANAKKAEDSAAMAAKNYEAARQAVQHMVTRVADEDLARIPEMKEVRRRLLEDAAGFYTKLTELNPRDPRAYYERGGVYFLLQQYGKVRWDYEKAIELDPNNPEFHGALGGFSGGCPDVAFRDLKCALLHTNWALRLDPQNLRYHHDLAQLYFRSGEKDKAVAEMRKTAEMCDTDARRMTLYASASNMAGDVKGGLEWQKKAVGFAPDNPGLHEWLAKFYFALGENENAVAAATKAIALGNKARSDSADNLAFYRYVTRGDIYAAMGMYREALADYDKAAELAGFRSYTYKRRAVVHFHLKHYDRALADIAKSLELAPWDASALTWIPPEQVAKCPDELFRKGLADLADKTVENSKGGAEATGARARLYVALGQADKIIAECREAIRREPRNAKAHEQLGNVAIAANNRAWCLATSADLRLRQPAEALELAKKAVAIAPGTCSFLNTLGVAQYRAGDHKGAIESLEKSLALGARALNSVFLAMAHWQLGHKDEARSWYDKAAEWMEKEKPRNAEEFLRFRAEAAELLGIPEKPPPERTTPGKSK